MMNKRKEIEKLKEEINDIYSWFNMRLNNHKQSIERQDKEVTNCLVAITGRLERIEEYLVVETKTTPSVPSKTILVKKKGVK